MANKIFKRVFLLSFIFFLFFCHPALTYSNIVAKPGTFDHFQIDTSDHLISGNEYKIIIYAVDAFGNPVTMPQDSVKVYRVTVSGSATVNPVQFKSSEVTQAGLVVKFRDDKAEDVIFSLYEINSPFPVVEKRIKVIAGPINSLDIKTPASVRVGSKFDILISGMDRFGNIVCKDFDPSELNLFFRGDVSPQIKESRYLPDNCNVNVTLYTEKTGVFYVEASLLNRNITGKSDRIEVINADVASFVIETPAEAIAGEPFNVTISAIDKFNNFVKDFASKKEKLNIVAVGKGYIFPSEVSSYAFSDGRANISLRYDRAEDIKILVKFPKDSAIKGESNIVKILPPKVKRFEIISPETIIAGQKFKIKVTAYNQLDKIMSNYNLYGKTVILKSSGAGNITPNRVPPSEFVNGVATVEVMYDKAEKFQIFATVEDEKVPSKEIKIKEEKKIEKRKKKEVKPKKEVKTKKAAQLKETLLELKNVSLVETKNTSTLTLFIPDIHKYGGYFPTTKKSGNIMSVVIEVYPAKNKLTKPVELESEFIKEVSISEDKNKVLANIVLKKPLKYRILKKQNELRVEFGRP